MISILFRTTSIDVTLPDIPAGPIFLGLKSFKRSIVKSCDKADNVNVKTNVNSV
jgi:hypothetical protein